MDTTRIPFNIPYHTGEEFDRIEDALKRRHISGNGFYTKQVHKFFSDHFNFNHSLLTTSCTDALEMSAILCDIQPGDEVIMPSYTFVSTANAFILRGAKIKFVDSRQDHPGIDENKIAEVITDRTKAIVPVHYAGVACDMDALNELISGTQIKIIEDAAQAIDSYYKNSPLGSFGSVSTFSFHETKNIISGEGGLLVVNDPEITDRSEVIWEKGTNRSAFFRGQVDKYGWVDIGSSYLCSDMIAAFLTAQLDHLQDIQTKRKQIWNWYYEALEPLKERISLPRIPAYATNNAHMFYIVTNSLEERTALINHLNQSKISAVFHYQSLHASEYFKNQRDSRTLHQADRYTECLLRLPFYVSITENQVARVTDEIKAFYNEN